MPVPSDLRYTPDHVWVRAGADGSVLVGVTDTVAGLAGDFVYVDLPDPGTKVSAGEVLGTVEALKTVVDLVAPVSGIVTEVNRELEERPGLVNASPYEAGWVLRMDTSADLSRLLDAEAYASLTIPEAVREDSA